MYIIAWFYIFWYGLCVNIVYSSSSFFFFKRKDKRWKNPTQFPHKFIANYRVALIAGTANALASTWKTLFFRRNPPDFLGRPFALIFLESKVGDFGPFFVQFQHPSIIRAILPSIIKWSKCQGFPSSRENRTRDSGAEGVDDLCYRRVIEFFFLFG